MKSSSSECRSAPLAAFRAFSCHAARSVFGTNRCLGPRGRSRYASFQASTTATGIVYRVVNYSPLLDVFVLDVRSYRPTKHLDSPGERRSGHGVLWRRTTDLASERAEAIKSSMEGDRVRHASVSHRAWRTPKAARDLKTAPSADGPPLVRELEIAAC